MDSQWEYGMGRDSRTYEELVAELAEVAAALPDTWYPVLGLPFRVSSFVESKRHGDRTRAEMADLLTVLAKSGVASLMEDYADVQVERRVWDRLMAWREAESRF